MEKIKKKVLVVDDKDTIAKIIIIYLRQDYEINWQSNPLNALDAIREGFIPDLIVSDIKMPEMRGDSFLEILKKDELYKHIPVIMLSSEDSTSERIRLLSDGAEDYIVKPFNPLELKVRIKRIIG